MRFTTLTATPDGDEVRVESLRGDPHLVAPVVMVREGVLNAGFLSFEEIKRSVPGWNGRPVTAPPSANESGHPRQDGEFVSANEVEFLDRMKVGVIQNAEASADLATPTGNESSKGLRGEVWVNLRRVKEVGDMAVEAARRMAEGEELEVSTGYFHAEQATSGRHNGEPYEDEQFDLMPDHLALLPNETGACSWGDGCGAPRANHDLDTTTAMQANEALGARVLAVNNEGGDGDADGSTSTSGDEDPQGTLARIRALVTGDGPEGAADDAGPCGAANCGESCGCGGTPNETMDHNYEALAEQTAFDLETLKDMADERVQALAETVEDEGDEGDTDGSGDEGTADGAQNSNDGATEDDERVAELASQVESLTETVEDLAEAQNADPQAEAAREFLAENTDHDRETLDETPDELVVETAEVHGFAGTGQSGAAPRGTGVNRLGQGGAPSADPAANGDDDVEDYVANSGALSQLDAAENGGGDA